MMDIQVFFPNNLKCNVFDITGLSFKSIANKRKIVVDVQQESLQISYCYLLSASENPEIQVKKH